MRAVLLAIGLAGVLAGCSGGDGGGGDRLSREEFTRRADEICAEYDRRLEDLPDPQDVREIEALAAQAYPIAQEGVRRLRELRPPEELASEVARWLRMNDANVRSIQALQDAASRGATREVQRIASEAATNEQNADELARELGLEDCAAD